MSSRCLCSSTGYVLITLSFWNITLSTSSTAAVLNLLCVALFEACIFNLLNWMLFPVFGFARTETPAWSVFFEFKIWEAFIEVFLTIKAAFCALFSFLYQSFNSDVVQVLPSSSMIAPAVDNPLSAILLSWRSSKASLDMGTNQFYSKQYKSCKTNICTILT